MFVACLSFYWYKKILKMFKKMMKPREEELMKDNYVKNEEEGTNGPTDEDDVWSNLTVSFIFFPIYK